MDSNQSPTRQRALYSYCITHDYGLAPNPFGNVCTLAVCKPRIREHAKIGDWVLGTGSTAHGFENKVIYAMEVTNKMSMMDYDKFCKNYLKSKIPDIESEDLTKRVGDSIYDYSNGDSHPPSIRNSLHTEENRRTDLSGEYVLLSNNFYYFGSKPISLDERFKDFVHQAPNCKKKEDQKVIADFIRWLTHLGKTPNTIHAVPFFLEKVKNMDKFTKGGCPKTHMEEDIADENCPMVIC